MRILVCLLVAPCVTAAGGYDRRSVNIPMRDGVRLHTLILTPKDHGQKWPVVLLRTPYNAENRDPETMAYFAELAQEGYIFAVQDIRGKFKSEGEFVMLRPLRDRSNPKSADESSDTWDSIDWLVKNIPGNNGRVGMLGVSYDGWLTVMGQLDPHPALKATSPQASPADMYLGDDFHHNGAFRLSYGFEYAAMMETEKENRRFQFTARDTYEWYWRLGPLGNVNRDYLKNKIPTWNHFVSHPDYDSFWQSQAVGPMLKRVTVPTLNVAGWWDQEDYYGPLEIYRTLEANDRKHENFVVVGPWNHGGWSRGSGESLGRIQFGSNTAEYFREKVQAPWFAHHLKGKGKWELPEAYLFRTGLNRWMSYDEWPPRRAPRKLYLRAGGRLSFDAPDAVESQTFDAYLSDPDNPVPYRTRPVEETYGPGSRWSTWLVEDQRFVHRRPDVASWQTGPLADDITVAGEITAHLLAATSGTDSDWVVKLIDVYPDDDGGDAAMSGYQLMVANDVFRGRYRKSFERPEPLRADMPEEYKIGLHWANHTFRKGHRIMVQVQSTWFPLIDRNPQKFVPNIFEAQPEDFQKATQRVYRGTYLSLPVE
ncbi:MAG: CocE/NonD family hydrolase [Bryobacterales bacterium]|nr:CocE/NonD family hydrolase [Bryobacterales bacterium]